MKISISRNKREGYYAGKLQRVFIWEEGGIVGKHVRCRTRKSKKKLARWSAYDAVLEKVYG